MQQTKQTPCADAFDVFARLRSIYTGYGDMPQCGGSGPDPIQLQDSYSMSEHTHLLSPPHPCRIEGTATLKRASRNVTMQTPERFKTKLSQLGATRQHGTKTNPEVESAEWVS